MFERHSEEFEQEAKLFFERLVLSHAVPTALGNILHVAEGEPDAAGIDTGLDRLLCGEAAGLAEHDVPGQHASVLGTELVGDSYPKLTQTHCITLTKVNGPQRSRARRKPRTRVRGFLHYR
jgi:hypothetical protein